jgi:beta-glucanase (GH16 family)
MVHKVLVFCLLILCSFTLVAQKKNKLKVTLDKEINCVNQKYNLVFHDEFDGNSLDTSKWYTFYPYGPKTQLDSCGFCRTHTSVNIYRDENCQVNDGKLWLKTDKIKGEWFGKTYDYTSGLVHSKQNFTTYGKYEIRCKLPKGKQQWPAFWIFGWNTEIDVFEFICRGPNKPEFSIHNWLTPYCPDRKKAESGAPCYTSASGIVDFGIDFSKDFHTFSMEYEPHMIKFYIDDIMIRYVPKYYDLKGRPINSCKIPPGEYLMEPAFPNYGEPVQVVAAESVCRKHKEKKPVFPNFMEVDYIRVYQKEIQPDLLVQK